MPWKVKAHAWSAKGRRFKEVIATDQWDGEALRQLDYWVRNMDYTDKIVIRRTK